MKRTLARLVEHSLSEHRCSHRRRAPAAAAVGEARRDAPSGLAQRVCGAWPCPGPRRAAAAAAFRSRHSVCVCDTWHPLHIGPGGLRSPQLRESDVFDGNVHIA